LLRVKLPSRNGEKLEPEEGGDFEDEAEDGKRAEINTFSDKSRRNFRDDMAAILTEARRNAVLTTLTYPAEFPDPTDRLCKYHNAEVGSFTRSTLTPARKCFSSPDPTISNHAFAVHS